MWGPGGTEAQAQLSPGLATPALQAEGGLPPLPPEAGEGSEEAANFGLVGVVVVEVHGSDGGHGGEAASSGPAILAGVTSPETAAKPFQVREGVVDSTSISLAYFLSIIQILTQFYLVQLLFGLASWLDQEKVDLSFVKASTFQFQENLFSSKINYFFLNVLMKHLVYQTRLRN